MSRSLGSQAPSTLPSPVSLSISAGLSCISVPQVEPLLSPDRALPPVSPPPPTSPKPRPKPGRCLLPGLCLTPGTRYGRGSCGSVFRLELIPITPHLLPRPCLGPGSNVSCRVPAAACPPPARSGASTVLVSAQRPLLKRPVRPSHSSAQNPHGLDFSLSKSQSPVVASRPRHSPSHPHRPRSSLASL